MILASRTVTLARTVVLAAVAAAPAGCQIVGVAAENYKRESTRPVKAEYEGLAGKSFAVVVVADRSTQAEHPGLTDYLTGKITERLATPTNKPTPGGYVPAADVLKYLYDHPSWTVRSRSELATELGGVERLVVIEVQEYRLHDPGNAYVWDGLAAGTVSVYDPTSSTPDFPAFEKGITVKFPDKTGTGPDQLSSAVVNTELARRFVDRTSWLLYEHQEPYYPDY